MIEGNWKLRGSWPGQSSHRTTHVKTTAEQISTVEKVFALDCLSR